MIRRALIIYCNNTESGPLPGPSKDNDNFCEFLQSSLGGEWDPKEIRSLQNPTSESVLKSVREFLNGADYTFTIFTGHGFINTDDHRQYIELEDKSIPLLILKSTAEKQTVIVDACRGFLSLTKELKKAFSESYEHFSGKISTRDIFDKAISSAEKGWSILYAASQDQTALDTADGAAYLLSLIATAKKWEASNKRNHVLNIKEAHDLAKTYINENFETIQIPKMNAEKRLVHFPFAVKLVAING